MTKYIDRDQSLKQIRQRETPWDAIVIGGGATGIAIAMDAASRGLEVLLLERFDFGKGTSSRSTKLVHGGVRYLKQGNVTLVRDALKERTLLRQNAPHLVHDMSFVIPCASLWQWFFYGIGLKVYDLLATGNSFGRSRFVTAKTATELSPTLKPDRLAGGVLYHDGQFDDTRLLLNMAQTAGHHGACLINYMGVCDLIKSADGKIHGVTAIDHETEERHELNAKVVINAAGPFCDAVRQMDQPTSTPMIAPSQGVHIVLSREFYPGQTAMIVPKTSDGRVIFIVPWHDHAIVGTTDTAIPEAIAEPKAQEDEIQFLLETTAQYLSRAPGRNDVQSVFVGIRPLVKGDKSAKTASLSRDHTIRISDSDLITITGGKWTTVRKMAEDCVDRLVSLGGMNAKPCQTKSLSIHGSTQTTPAERAHYGTDLVAIERLESEDPSLAKPLHASLQIRSSEVVWAVRHEMARTVEDVLARRTRALFLNAAAAVESSATVAKLIARERGLGDDWCVDQVQQFAELAEQYTVVPKVQG